MIKSFVGTCAVAVAAGLPIAAAQATVIDFQYDAVFEAKGQAITTAVEGQRPHIDPASKPDPKTGINGLTGNDFTLSVSGSYNTDDIANAASGQTVFANITSITSNIFGTIYYKSDMKIQKTGAGVFTLSYLLPEIFSNSEFYSVYSPTSITADAIGSTALPKNASLTQTGIYKFSADTLTNLYGTSAKGGLKFGDDIFSTLSDYLKYGADVENGKAGGGGGGVGAAGIYGELILSTPPAPSKPAVPEPASWALMIVGFGLVGGMARTMRVATRTSHSVP